MRQGVRAKRGRGGAFALSVMRITMPGAGAYTCTIAADMMSAAIGIHALR
jgi:hypothetical protein